MNRSVALALASFVALAGCTDPELEQRLTQMETRTKALEEKVAQLESRPAGPARQAQVDPEQEKAASALLREASQLNEKMDYDGAKAKLAQLNDKYPDTRSNRQARRLAQELEIIGKDAGDMEVEKWFQGKTAMADGEATLLVFWEVWCPHCRREVPKVQATFDKYNGKGLNLVGLTKITKTSTDEKVTEFISENNLTYPIAKETGSLSQRFGVRGIPAAAVVKDGKIVWRGHPAKINDQMIEGWISG